MKEINYNVKTIFHVHSFRCKHAEMVSDEEYIKRSVELGAEDICFTDHIPFPGDEINMRMSYAQLSEYIDTLKKLKDKYNGIINVNIGLEAEYLPSFYDYYKELYNNPDIDILLLGQHLYEMSDGNYNYTLSKEEWHSSEMEGCGEAIIQAMKTGMFSVCAHPDRIFRYAGNWNEIMSELSERIIRSAAENNVVLEKNLSSFIYDGYFRPEFWKLVPKSQKVIIGLDAHKITELDRFIDSEKYYECIF